MADDFKPSNIPPVGEERPAGMDHAHYPVRFLPDAPRFAWPGGARIAFLHPKSTGGVLIELSEY